MFKIEFYVNDPKLGKSLRALVGLAVGKPEVTPVHTAQDMLDAGQNTLGGEVKESGERNFDFFPKPNGKHAPRKDFKDTIPGKVAIYFTENGLTEVTLGEVKTAIKKVKGNPNSSSYVMKYLKSHNVLESKGYGKYLVKEISQ